jgi:hypothetical protein
MVNLGSKDKRPRVVLLLSVATSIVLMSLLLLGVLLTSTYLINASYTLVDITAGCIFVFVITMIISLSLWPRGMDMLERGEKSE